jgi:hypothetical protein
MLLEQILERMGEVGQVVLVGDISKGIDSGKIDVVVTGENLNKDYIKSLTKRIEEMIERKVVFMLKNDRYESNGLVLFDTKIGV